MWPCPAATSTASQYGQAEGSSCDFPKKNENQSNQRGLPMPDRRSLLFTSCAAGLALFSVPAAAQAVLAPKTDGKPLDPAVLGSAEAPLPGISIAPDLYPVVVSVKPEFLPGTIIVVSPKHYLYFVTRKGQAIRYGVAVGKKELQFRGLAQVGAKTEWPRWKPTAEMVARNPGAYAKYAEKGMEGGPGNPLGARAIYLHQDGIDTAVRIHGTIEPNSIGKDVSNGCIRMLNEHVTDLYSRVQLGAEVKVF
jgi:lipoprotein-anchoring transpeptidase ErfK/SrfK